MRIYIFFIEKGERKTFYGKILSINALLSWFIPFPVSLYITPLPPPWKKQASIPIPFKPSRRLFRLYPDLVLAPSPISSSPFFFYHPLSFLTYPLAIVPSGSLVTVPWWPCTGGRKPPRNKGEHSLTWTYRGSDDPGSGRLSRPNWQKPDGPLSPLRGPPCWWNAAARVCVPWH